MQKPVLKNLRSKDESAALFLDRDGVINKRLMDDYVKSTDEFEFLDKVPEAIAMFAAFFERIFVVTNQQGIGKGLMTEQTLNGIHEHMLKSINESGGRIDKIYFCGELKDSKPFNRKPQVGMGLKARKDFPDIDLNKSVMAGDTLNDMIFGKRLGMTTVLIGEDRELLRQYPEQIDHNFKSLYDFAKYLKDE